MGLDVPLIWAIHTTPPAMFRTCTCYVSTLSALRTVPQLPPAPSSSVPPWSYGSHDLHRQTHAGSDTVADLAPLNVASFGKVELNELPKTTRVIVVDSLSVSKGLKNWAGEWREGGR